MPDWTKLFNKVEKVVDDALAKLDDKDKITEVEAPPIEPQSVSPAMVDKIAEAVMDKLAKGGPVATSIAAQSVKSTCPVCGQERQDAVIGGFSEHYMNFDGEFSRERFQQSLICRRCGVAYDLDAESLRKAKEEWAKVAEKGQSEEQIRESVERFAREAHQHMYNFTTKDDE